MLQKVAEEALKVCLYYSVTFIDPNSNSIWLVCVVWCGEVSKNKHHKNMCYQEVEVCLQLSLTTPHSTVNHD